MTGERDKEIRELVEKGYNDVKIAQELEMNRSHVGYRRKQMGLASAHYTLIKYHEQVRTLHSQGCNDHEIAEKLGISRYQAFQIRAKALALPAVVTQGNPISGRRKKVERVEKMSTPSAKEEAGIVVLYMRAEEDAGHLLMTLKRVQSYDHRRGVSDHNDRHYAIDGIIDALENRTKVR